MKLKGICIECIVKPVCKNLCSEKCLDLELSARKRVKTNIGDSVSIDEIVKELNLETGKNFKVLRTSGMTNVDGCRDVCVELYEESNENIK